MISISSIPASATPGTTVCIFVTGATTVPTVDAEFNMKSLVPRITGGKGSYMICVTLPRGQKGSLDFTVSAGMDVAVAGVSVY